MLNFAHAIRSSMSEGLNVFFQHPTPNTSQYSVLCTHKQLVCIKKARIFKEEKQYCHPFLFDTLGITDSASAAI